MKPTISDLCLSVFVLSSNAVMIFIFPSILTHQLQLLLQAFRPHNHSLYNFYRDQSYILVDGKYRRRDKDHESVIGYDDMNQLFWYSKGLKDLFWQTRNLD